VRAQTATAHEPRHRRHAPNRYSDPQWQALREAAGQFGLCPGRADEALGHMLEGALATLLQSGLPPAAVMDLIPVRPLQAIEESVTAAYDTALPALFAKIRPTA